MQVAQACTGVAVQPQSFLTAVFERPGETVLSPLRDAEADARPLSDEEADAPVMTLHDVA